LSSGIGSQREYCERHGLSLKSFGNWRGQLKREDVAGGDARWGRYPRLRHMVSPMATPMANEAISLKSSYRAIPRSQRASAPDLSREQGLEDIERLRAELSPTRVDPLEEPADRRR
jgi:hypothetical protein